MKKVTYFSFLTVLFLFSALLMGCSLASLESTVDSIYLFIKLFIGLSIGCIVLAVFLGIRRGKRLREIKAKAEIEIAKLKEMSMHEFLRQNGFEQYGDAFKQNKIEKVYNALELTDSDLVNMGISVLTDRKKLLSLFAEKLSAAKGPQQRCPRCGSTNYQPFSGIGGVAGAQGFACNDCKATFMMPKIS
jgi:hypothetical protein